VTSKDKAVDPGDPEGDGVRARGPGAFLIDAFYRIPSPLGPAPPGSIIRSSVIDAAGQLPAGATAYRVIYHSQSITGADIAVSGLVVVPGGTPPANGFPIVSWAHGTAGLADQCAPSLGGLSSISYLSSLLNHRMIVAATDYQGLGTPGNHPYLVGQSEAQGVLDAARAARDLEGRSASNTVMVIGYSQGGQAALFAGQIALSYAPELYVAGIVAIGPVTSIAELAPAVPGDDADPDAGFAAMALYAWSATYGDLPLASVFTNVGLRDTAVITSACSAAVGAVYDTTPTKNLFRAGWSANPMVRADDAVNQPEHSPISAPVMVVQGTNDSLVPYGTTTKLVDDNLCHSEHDTVRYVPIAGASHSGALQDGASAILGWVSLRMAGAPEGNSCSAAGSATHR
jgi:pimeloyl-ACP methyl ester carboxylesterase